MSDRFQIHSNCVSMYSPALQIISAVLWNVPTTTERNQNCCLREPSSWPTPSRLRFWSRVQDRQIRRLMTWMNPLSAKGFSKCSHSIGYRLTEASAYAYLYWKRETTHDYRQNALLRVVKSQHGQAIRVRAFLPFWKHTHMFGGAVFAISFPLLHKTTRRYSIEFKIKSLLESTQLFHIGCCISKLNHLWLLKRSKLRY